MGKKTSRTSPGLLLLRSTLLVDEGGKDWRRDRWKRDRVREGADGKGAGVTDGAMDEKRVFYERIVMPWLRRLRGKLVAKIRPHPSSLRE